MQENKIVKRIPTNLVTKTIITSSAEYEPNKEYTDEDANIYEKYLQAITNVSIGINDDIEKIKALEDNILEQYNKNVELANKMKQETEKFAKQANTAIEDYNSNAETKAEEFNTNAKEKTDEFNSNATEKKTEISDIADVFDANVEEKTNTFNSNVETKTTEFNNNSNTKTEEFNNNSTEKINAFNSNAEEKIADYNEHVETLTSRIADLEEETDDLFNALDTEKISGTELYIEDAKPCRIINTEISGMYKQETTKGTNIMNLNVAQSSKVTVNEDGTVTINGAGGFGLVFESFTFKANIPYYIKWEIVSGNIPTDLSLVFYNSINSKWLIKDKFNTIIPKEDKEISSFWIHQNAKFENAKIRIWISESQTGFEPYTGKISSPNPDYPQAIEQVDSMKLQCTGSNLLDYTKILSTPSTTSGITIKLEENGNITISGKPKYSYFSVIQPKNIIDILKDGETYYLDQSNYNRYFYTEIQAIKADGSITYIGPQKSYASFKVNKSLFKKYVIKIICGSLTSWGEEERTVTSNFKLTRQKNLPFEKYIEKTVNIDLKGNKLCAVSDTIKDKLLIDKNGNVALQKNVIKINFPITDKTSWQLESNNLRIGLYDLNLNVKDNKNQICNYFSVYNRYVLVANSFALAPNFIRFRNDKNFTDITELKTWLSENDLYAYCEIATPELIDLGQLTELPKTFNGINNIWAETNLGNTEIEIEYVQDVKKLLEKQAEQQNARLDNIEALLSTTQTSALLLDNMQNDLEKEVE